MRREVGQFDGVANAIESCIDERGKILDTASRRLSALRREMGQVEDRIKETLTRMLRSNEIKRILRYPNFTMVGHHYVLPIAKEHRGEIQGSVHRTSASNETVYVEPQAIAEQSAQLSFLRSKEAKEIRRILRWLSAQVGQVADSLLGTLETLAELDLIFARGRYSLDYRLTPPDFNQRRQAPPPGGPAPAPRSPLPGRPKKPPDRRAEARRRTSTGRAAEPPPPPPGRAPDGRADRRPPRLPVPDAGRHRAEHGRQDGRPEDGGPAGDHGPGRPAHPGAIRGRNCRSSTTSWPTSATSRASNSRSRPSPRTSAGSRRSSPRRPRSP